MALPFNSAPMTLADVYLYFQSTDQEERVSLFCFIVLLLFFIYIGQRISPVAQARGVICFHGLVKCQQFKKDLLLKNIFL